MLYEDYRRYIKLLRTWIACKMSVFSDTISFNNVATFAKHGSK